MKTPPPNLVDPHLAACDRYVVGVITGMIPAGHWVRKAAQRHLDDLRREGFAYEFKPERGTRVCRFLELLPHTKGRWAASGEKIKLQDWQCFLVVVLFGWVRKDNPARRRFQWAYWELPRKSGKSILGAGIGLYMAFADGEFGAEVYSGATTEKQAWEVFRPARLMIERSQALRDRLGVEVCAKQLVRIRDGSKFEPVIGNPGDGASPSCAIVDEFHEHDTPALYDTMETGMLARENPLLLVITTAGYNIAGPCHEKHDEVGKILDGVLENEQLFGVMYGLDPGDPWESPASLIKANPGWGVSVDPDRLLAQQKQAMLNPIQQGKFKTKHLNEWCNVANGLVNMQTWQTFANPLLVEDDFYGCEAWVAIDLASKSDLCTEQKLFRRVESDGLAHYYLFGRYWLPEAAIEEPGPNHAHYAKWISLGLLTETEGATVDFELIAETVLADCRRINPKELVYDPFNATQLAQVFMGAGIECVEFVQQPTNFALPIDEMQAALRDGRFHHDGNQITTWCMSNVVGRPSKKGLMSPVKQKGKEHQKIDGAVACFMAIGRASAHDIRYEVNVRHIT